MPNRRDLLRGASAAVLAAPALVQAQQGPFEGATARFRAADLHVLPPWAFKRELKPTPVARPTRIGPFEALDGEPHVFGPTDPVPIGGVFHGTAREWGETPSHWGPEFGCEPDKPTRAERWNDKRDKFGSVASYQAEPDDDRAPRVRNWGGFPIKCYKLPIAETEGLLRPDAAAPARLYGYGGMVPGPTFKLRMGQPVVVRWENHLETEVSVHLHGAHSPSHSDGFPSFYVLQGKSRDYFYPNIMPAKFPRKPRDPYIPDEGECQSTMWYHDHGMDATAYNVSKGLAGFALCFGEQELRLIRKGVLPGLGEASCVDPDLEGMTDADVEDPKNPGFYAHEPGKEPYFNPFEVPIVLQDKVIDLRTGQVSYDGDGHNGYLGDTFFVNGQAWPYKEVPSRKHRLRILNGSNARFYHLRLLAEADYLRAVRDGLDEEELARVARPFLRIGKDSWLFDKAFEARDVMLAMANRADLVVDFAALTADEEEKDAEGNPTGRIIPGPRVFYLVNTMPQTDGRGPKDELVVATDPRVLPLPFDTPDNRVDELRRPIALLKFEVTGDPPAPGTDATVENGTELIKHDPIDDEDVQVVREFIFHRGKGAWMVNERFYDPTIANAAPTSGTAEEWVLRNGGGGWWHPIHIHMESHQIVRYEKDFAADAIVDPNPDPPINPQQPGLLQDVTAHIPIQEILGYHDTQTLGPNTAVRIRLRFRTFTGPFVFHCHNLEHEDMRMMQNFEVVHLHTHPDHDPNVAPAARTHGEALTLDGKAGELPWEYRPVPASPVRDAGVNVIPPRS